MGAPTKNDAAVGRHVKLFEAEGFQDSECLGQVWVERQCLESVETIVWVPLCIVVSEAAQTRNDKRSNFLGLRWRTYCRSRLLGLVRRLRPSGAEPTSRKCSHHLPGLARPVRPSHAVPMSGKRGLVLRLRSSGPCELTWASPAQPISPS